MTHNTQSPNVFCVIVLRSDGTSVVLPEPLPAGVSKPSGWIDLPPQQPIRAGYTEIGDYVAQQELDVERRALLERARRDLSEKAYGERSDASLRRLRLARGWSQSTLAKAIGTTQAHIARIENAELDPQASTLERLGEALGETPDAILRAFLTVKRSKPSANYDR